jgi:hypothetical protein
VALEAVAVAVAVPTARYQPSLSAVIDALDQAPPIEVTAPVDKLKTAVLDAPKLVASKTILN